MVRPVSWVVLATSLFLVRVLAAQGLQTGNISGRVDDPSGGRLAAVTVTLSGPVLIAPRTTTTDSQGEYRFASLAPGVYALAFELSGFKRLNRSGVTVAVATTSNVDARMEVGQMTDAVDVVGEAPTVDVTQTNIATNLNYEHIQQIPTARDVWAILQNMAPQVVLDREDVGGSEGGLQAVFSAHGSSWHQNTYAFNGADVTDPAATGATDFYFDYDSFEEVHISTAQHPAEVGTPGVYYNMVARRGTDEFHGGLAYYFSNSGTVSDNISQELRDQGITGGTKINLFSDATGQLGGPIIKDKLRFFTAIRDWRIHRDVLGFPQSENTDLFSWLVNTSYQINEKNRIDGLFTRQTYYKPNRNASALVPPESTWVEDDVFRIYQGHYSSQITSNALFDLRASYVSIDFPLGVQPGVTQPNKVETTTGVNSGAAGLDLEMFRSRWSIDGTMSFFKGQWGGANHDLKAGFQFYRGYIEETDDATDGVNLTTFNGDAATVLQFTTPIFFVNRFKGQVLFAQDSISKDRFTLNLGLRFEHTKGDLPAQASPAGPFAPERSFPQQDVISWSNLAPRLGFVYDLTGKRNAALKLGYSRYHHAISTGMINTPNQNGLGGRGFAWSDSNGDGRYQVGEEGDLLFAFGGSITSIDPDLKRPRTDEFTAGLEFALPRNIKLSITGIYRKGRDLIGITEVGIPQNPSSYIQTTVSANGQTYTAYNLRPELVGQNRLLETNPADFETKYKGIEVTLQRRFADRWQGLLSYALSRADLSSAAVAVSQFGGEEEGAGGIGATAGPNPFTDINLKTNNTDGPSFYDRTHIFKLNGSYIIPKADVTVAAVLKLQTGTPFGRIVSFSQDANGVPFNQGPISFFGDPRDANRFPTLKLFDFRVSKLFTLQKKHQLEAIVDVFNVFNSNTVTNVNPNDAAFGGPLSILGPRVFRLGARWKF